MEWVASDISVTCQSMLNIAIGMMEAYDRGVYAENLLRSMPQLRDEIGILMHLINTHQDNSLYVVALQCSI